MKLVIVLSIIAYGYAEKLDRAYLPPANAATAGGSPGSLIAPGVASSRPGSSQGPAGQVDLGQGLPTGSGQSRPTYGGVSGGAQNGPSFGTAFDQGSAATAGGRPGSLIAPGVSSLRPGSNQGPAGQVNLGQGLPTGSEQSRPTYGGVSGGAQNGPSFGTGFNQGSSGINQLPGASTNALEPIGKAPLLGANAPIAQGQTFGSSLTPTNTFNVGGQQITRPQAGGYSNQGFGQGTQGFNAPQTQSYKPERPQAAADRNAEILKYVNENNGESYLYSYETSNGISAEESGVATNGVRAQGGFSYTGDDGQAYSLTYTADENGFRPQGEHLPTPHPIPEEILKSIEENARAAAAGTQEGAYRPEDYESEGSAQQYNIGQSSFNRPQGSIQGPLSQGTSIQSSGNKASAIQGAFGPSGQIGQSKPSQFASGPQGQVTQYQQGSASNQGAFGPSTGQTGQFGQARPSQGSNQFSSGLTGNQYQTGLGSSQGPSGQLSGQGSVTQGLGPTSQGSSGYNYNQPQSTFGAQFGSGIQSQNRPQFNQGQTPSASGSQQNFGLQTGKIPASETPFGSAQVSQFGLSQSQSSVNRPTSSTGIFGQGQIQDSNKTFGSSQESQLRPGNQGTSGTSGYQYQANLNRPSYGNNQTPGIGSQPSQGSQYQPNANQPTYGSNGIKGSSPFGAGNVGSNNQIGQSQQYQPNGNRPFGASNQGSSSIGGISGIQKPGSGSFTGQVNRPSFGSSVGPSQGSSQFAPVNQQSTSAQGPAGTKGSTSIQAPYQYDRPSQSFPSQGPSGSFGNQGSQSPIATGGSLVSQGFNGPKPGGSQGQRPGFNSQETQDYMNGRPTFMGTQGFNVQRPDGSSSVSQGSSGSPSLIGSQEFNRQRPDSSFSGSPSVIGQRPTFTASQGANQGPSGSSSGFQVQGQRPSSPESTVSKGNQNQPEQFGGPRQPPSFSPEEGYKY